MFADLGLKVEYFVFEVLFQLDAAIAEGVAAAGCPFCKVGRLHAANYLRKPRSGVFGLVLEKWSLRHSLCCDREGCRKRVLPPSLRFLGRRVYLESVIVLACLCSPTTVAVRAAARATGTSARTLKRWQQWWADAVPQATWWQELRSRLKAPGPDESQLPMSLVAHLAKLAEGVKLGALIAQCLAPATTWLTDSASFVGAVMSTRITG